MTSFISEKTNTISIWTKGNKEIQQKYSFCNNNVMIGSFIYHIEKIIDNKSIKKSLDITRLICGNKILEEDIKIS